MKKKSKKKFIKNTPGAGFLKAGAFVIAVAMVIGAGVFKLTDPADDEILEAVNPPYVAEEIVELPPEPAAPADVPEKKERERQRIKPGSILLYIAGWAVSLLATLLGKVAGPLAAKILGWVLFAAAVLGALFFALKKAFPDLKLKDLVPPKTGVLAVLAIAAIIAVCELVYYLRGSAWMPVVQGIAFAGGLAVILIIYNVCSNLAVKLPLRES